MLEFWKLSKKLPIWTEFERNKDSLLIPPLKSTPNQKYGCTIGPVRSSTARAFNRSTALSLNASTKHNQNWGSIGGRILRPVARHYSANDWQHLRSTSCSFMWIFSVLLLNQCFAQAFQVLTAYRWQSYSWWHSAGMQHCLEMLASSKIKTKGTIGGPILQSTARHYSDHDWQKTGKYWLCITTGLWCTIAQTIIGTS